MTELKLVVDNKGSIKYQILENLRFNDGKFCSVWFAIRNIDDTQAAFKALDGLEAEGLIEKRVTNAEQYLVWYRYKSELNLLRRMGMRNLHPC